jgi:TetR/AcrR family transcriptional regulator, mexJK operon transcriptional repressor
MANGMRTRTARTHSAILKAAERLFLKHGYLDVAMDQVAAEAKVSKQTIYAHFQNKESLFMEFVRQRTGIAGDTLAEAVRDEPYDPALQSYLLRFAEKQVSIVLTPDLMHLRRLAISEASRFPEFGRLLHRMGPGRSIGRLEKAFRHYRSLGQMTAKDLGEAASNFNWLLMGGPSNDAMMLGTDAIPTKANLQRHAEECVRVFMAAYGLSSE